MNMMSNKEIGVGNLLSSGLTLKQHRDAIIERTQASGHYNGLEKLAFRDSDPIGYEKLFSKLRGGLVHGQADAAAGVQADDVPVQHFFEFNRGSRRQGVRLRHDEHQMVAAVGAALQRAAMAGGGHVAQPQVGGALLHRVQHGGAQVLLQVDLDLAVRACEGTQVFGQKLHDGGNIRVHAHMATHAAGVFAQLALHALQPEQHGARMVQQAFASGGQRHAAAVAVQQGRVDRSLQVGQALAHRRGGDVFALGGAANAAQLAHRNKQLQ